MLFVVCPHSRAMKNRPQAEQHRRRIGRLVTATRSKPRTTTWSPTHLKPGMATARGVEARRGEVLGFYGQDARRDETGSVCAKAGIPVSRMAENRVPQRLLRATLLEGYQEAVLFSPGFAIRGKMLH